MRFLGRTFIFVLFILSFFVAGSVHAGNIDSTYKYAEFIDSNVIAPRINFGTTEGNVTVTDSAVTGHAWSAEYGWINLAPTNSGVVNDGNGVLSGYAWGEGTGWVNFKPTNGGVTINTSTGDFSGYAWAQNVGWISFNCADEGVCGSNDYKVKTSWPVDLPQCSDGIDNDGDGLIDHPDDPGCDSALDDDESNGGGGGGGGQADITVVSYLCSQDVSINRSINGPNANGNYTVPNLCKLAAGLKFGYVTDRENDTSGPFPGIDDASSFFLAGLTNSLGKISLENVNPNRRYAFAELYGDDNERIPDSKYYGLACYGDDNSVSDNYDLTFPQNNQNRYCVAYRTNDLCDNLSGIQRTVPKDWEFDGNAQCVPSVGDLCPNISGSQTEIPSGLYVDAIGNCVEPQQCQLLPDELKQDVDIIVAIDVSGSMWGSTGDGQTKMEAAKEAASLFLDGLDPVSDRVGLVTYNSRASLRSGLTSDYAAVDAQISTLRAGGGTNIGDSINVAYNELLDNGRDEAKKVIITLSDGYTSSSGYARAQADQAKIAGIISYSIGLGSSVDQSLLQDIASSLKHYYHAPNSSDLAGIYGEISAIECTARPSTVSGFTINDQNNNGLFDSGEPPLTGRVVTLASTDGIFPTRQAVTDSNGDFSFENVTEGSYSLCQLPVSGWRFTILSSAPSCYNVFVLQGVDYDEITFGSTEDASFDAGEKPKITLIGNNPLILDVGDSFTDPGATASDAEDGDITSSIIVTGTVDTDTVGSYALKYNVSDSDGNFADTVTRIVEVGLDDGTDPDKRPVITLVGADPFTVSLGDIFTDPGSTAFDPEDGNITSSIVVTGTVDTATIGSYVLSYNVTDSDGNKAITVTRVVDVVSGVIPPEVGERPVITLTGDDSLAIDKDSIFTDPGATASDAEDGDITSDIVVTGFVDTTTIGSYVLSYNVTDSDGNRAITVTRVVDVVFEVIPPGDPNPDPRPDPNPQPDPNPKPFPFPFPNPFPSPFPIPIPSWIPSAVTLIGALTGTLALLTSLFANPFTLGELFTLPFRLWSLFLSFIGLRKRYTPWGVVYDSVTKQPLDPAYVVLTDRQGLEIGTSITDLDGRYGFLTHPGTYKLVANKTNYTFPSQQLAGRTKDEMYEDLYFGGEINIDEENAVITKNIPLDPVNFDWNEFAKKDKRLMRFYSRFDKWFFRFVNVMYYIGFFVAIAALFIAPVLYNIVIFGIYIAVAILRILGIKPKQSGHVKDKQTGNPLSFGLIRVYAPGIDQPISKRTTDAYGRYFMLVPQGEYYVTFDRKNQDGSYIHVFTSKLIKAKRGIIAQDFRV